jgi:hypothetical protein
MADLQVTCIRKIPRDNPHEGITAIGGFGWILTTPVAIQHIRFGTNTFFTQVNGRFARVAVVDGPNGPYLRNHADGYWTNNLLALAECLY